MPATSTTQTAGAQSTRVYLQPDLRPRPLPALPQLRQWWQETHQADAWRMAESMRQEIARVERSY